jgi:hypothetical protein
MHIVRTTAGEAKSSILPKLLLNFVQFASLFQNSRNILEIFRNFIILQFCETFRETTAVLLVSLIRETQTSIFNKTLLLYLQYTTIMWVLALTIRYAIYFIIYIFKAVYLGEASGVPGVSILPTWTGNSRSDDM